MFAVFAATLAVYLPALNGGLIWNDSDYVTRAALQPLSGLRRIWFQIGATQQYYPVLHSFFWMEHRVWGDAPLGYHLAGVLLHATSACLLVRVMRLLAIPGGWLAALVFALHPVCAESVAWISEQKNTLSGVFYLLACLLFLRWQRGGGEGGSRARGWLYASASAVFALALLSKTVTATLPGALLVILWWKKGRLEWRRDVTPLMPWFAAGAAAGLFSGWVERRYIGAEGSDFALNGLQRCLVAGRAIWFYLSKAAWPHPLMFIYPRWTPDPSVGWQWLFPLAALAAGGLLWGVRNRSRGPLAAGLYFAGTLFPVLGFLNVYAFIFSFVADHFQYLACLGVIVPAAALWERWRVGASRAWPVPAAAAASVLLGLGVLTWREAGRYRNLETFYSTILAANPDAWMAHNNLGIVAFDRGDLNEAVRQYRETIRLRPGYPNAHNNLGNALSRLGHSAEALAEYEAAVAADPRYIDGQNGLGNALADAGRLPEAERHLALAVRLMPEYAISHYNLANVLAAEDKAPEAVRQYEEAIRLNPGYPEAHNNLALTFAGEGRLAEAIAEYGEALRLSPGLVEAENNLGVALYRAGRPDEAVRHFEAALRRNPGYGEARRNLEALRRAQPSP